MSKDALCCHVISQLDRLISLLNYPRLATPFLKYNAPLMPSSAAVERLVVLGKYWSHADVNCLTQCLRNVFSYVIS